MRSVVYFETAKRAFVIDYWLSERQEGEERDTKIEERALVRGERKTEKYKKERG